MNTSEISLTGAAAVGSMRVLDGGKYPDSYYVQYDPFEGDRDVDVKMRTVRIVKARTEHKCWMGMCPPEKPHTIKVGERCRYERALIDSEKWWCRSHRSAVSTSLARCDFQGSSYL